jgi:outer membrane protein OmpA-like peptidoglycan-associated protein
VIYTEIYLMAKMLLCLFACIISFISSAQSLVGNVGFEERNVCVEYQVKCAPEAWFFLPRYARMSPVEPNNNHYEVISMGDPRSDYSVGNYIYTKLFCALVPKAQYRLSFRIYIPTFDFDYLDIWMSNGEPGSRRNSLYTAKAVTILPDSVSGSKKYWMQVNHTFTAKGGERFLTMGNFQQKALVKAKRSSRKRKTVEYYIDDVSLVALDPSNQSCPEYEAIKDQVYRNNPRHPGRFIESIPIDSSLLPQPPKRDTVVIDKPVIDTTPKTDTLIIPDVLFHFNSSRLNHAFAARLDSLGEKISGIMFTKLLIAGHTDNVGSDDYNLKLSADRAVTIKNYLADKFRLNKDLIEPMGFGESQPRAPNTTASGRQQNRRVEIIIYYK